MAADRIERIELFHVDVPLPTPFYPAWIPGYPERSRRATLLRLTTREGLVGHASGVAFHHEREGLGEFIGPFLLGLDPFDPIAAAGRLKEASYLGWQNAWMEVAFWDLLGQSRGVPMWRVLAERIGRVVDTPSDLPAYASFGELRSAKARAESIERAQCAGFRAAKIVTRDDAHVPVLRAFAGDAFELMIHAHQAWTVSVVERVEAWSKERALAFARVCHTHGIKWLQEPLMDEDFEALAEFTRESPLAIAGGDIAHGYSALSALAARGALGILTPDVTFSGLEAVVRVLARSLDSSLDFSPSTYGDGLGLMANLHALAAWGAATGELDRLRLEFPWEPPVMLPEHRDALLANPVHVSAHGRVSVPTEPGLGVIVDDKALRRYAHRFYTLTPVRFAVSSARRSGLRLTAAFARKAS